MLAYKGMRAGRRMESSISSKSLITGKVSTEESRKEIRNSPGAPSPPAKATIFCFQALNSEGNEIAPPKKSCLAVPRMEAAKRLLCKRGAVEMRHEDLHQR